MKATRILFWFWILLIDTLLLADLFSYYKIFSSTDFFQIINRGINTSFVLWFITIPMLILTVVLINSINRKNK